jgi:Flp pilus assembly protein TadD
MTAAKTNLALAYALQGNIPVAERRLLDHRNRAVGHYNVGILRMALGRYTDAVTSFETALTVGRAIPDAARRAAQARAMADETEREH